jgi:hypothetical protein
MTSQLWRVLLRAIVTDAALCTFRLKGREGDVLCRCEPFILRRWKPTFKQTMFCIGGCKAEGWFKLKVSTLICNLNEGFWLKGMQGLGISFRTNRHHRKSQYFFL